MTRTIAAPPAPLPAASPPRVRPAARRWQPLLVGATATLVAAVGAGTPSYWGDEAASVLSAQRSIPSLLGLLAHVDAVHGVYYLFLHGWIALFGTGELATRIPSAVAVGLAAAGTVVLGTRLLGPRLGLTAGLLFTLLPVTTQYGIEARSYGMVMAAAVWLTVLLLALVRRRERGIWPWAGFALAFAASIHLFVYLLLLAAVHATVVVFARPSRQMVVRWLAATTVAALVSLPFIALCVAQRQQIAFLARRHYATVESVVTGQWFGGSVWVAAAAWSLLLIAVAAGVFLPSHRRIVVIAGVWAAAPTTALLLGNAWLTPMYNPRYTGFSAPAIALLMATGLLALARLLQARGLARAVPASGVALLLLLTVPGFAAQRTQYAKDDGSGLRQTAAEVQARAHPGDGIVFDSSTKPSQRPRLALDLYPARFSGLRDIALLEPYSKRTMLWDRVATLPDIADIARRQHRIWAVELDGDITEVDQLRGLGFRVHSKLAVHRTTIYELVKE